MNSRSSPLSPSQILSMTATDLQSMLGRGDLTSVQLVETCLDQIESHNTKGLALRAMISVADREQVLSQARLLDQERKAHIRGPLHGIPIILKDTISTPSLNLETTLGSYALKGARTADDASIVQKFLKAGLIILGKANLSELGASKGFKVTAGWSAVGGQTQSAYVVGGVLPNATFLGHSTPAGSSSGSAVAVSAGFAPLSVGTETDGSVIQPAIRAGLYGLKLTPGISDMTGICGASPLFSTIGGIGKSPQDVAHLLSVVMDGEDYSSSLTRSWKGLRIGVVDYDLWTLLPFVLEPNEEFKQQTYEEMDAAIAKIKQAGATVKQPVPLITHEEVFSNPLGAKSIDALMQRDSRRSFESFFQMFETIENVRTLEDLVAFNKRHADLELPPEHSSQEGLEAAIRCNMTDEEYHRGVKLMREAAINSIMESFSRFEVDVIIGPADARMPSVAATAGFPCAALPLGYAKFNGRAFGMVAIAGNGQESKLFEVMSAWEVTFPEARKPPPQLVDWSNKYSKS